MTALARLHCKDVESRVRYCLEAMGSGANGTTVTQRRAWATQLAKDWGVSLSMVRSYTAEAHRRLRADPDELDALRQEALDELRTTMQDEDPDVRLRAFDRLDRLMQLSPPQRLQVEQKSEEWQWRRVKEWLRDPSPELRAALHETGWQRIETEGESSK